MRDSGDFEAALEAYAEMMGGDEEDKHISYMARALTLEELGRLDEAIEFYWLARRQKPEFEQTAGALYYCLMGAGRFDEAVEVARRLFDGRLEQVHPDPILEDFRQMIKKLLNLDEKAYNRVREECIRDGLKPERPESSAPNETE